MANEPKDKPHSNIRGKESYAQAIEGAKGIIETPIQRLRAFVQWAQSQRLCKSEYDFERQCGLSAKYISNNANTGKGNIGTEMLGRIIRVFPQLNLGWLCTGKGQMIQGLDGGIDYKLAYDGAMAHISALNKIIEKIEREKQI